MALWEPLEDGHGVTITYALDATVKIQEREVTMPGFGMGGKSDMTSMRNAAVTTGKPKKLKTLSDGGAVVFFSTGAFTAIWNMLGKNQLIQYNYPDKATYKHFGWIEEFKVNPFRTNETPTANMTHIASNLDEDGDEYMPVYTAPPPPPP